MHKPGSTDPVPTPPSTATQALSRGALLALACSIGLVPLNSTMIAVAIPAIALDLAVAPGDLLQWLVTGYLMVTIVAQSPAGKLGDRWGHARVLTLGQCLFAVGSVAGFLAHALPLLVLARVSMAVGGAMIVPCAMAMVRLRLSEAQRAPAFGLFGGVMSLSAAIGPLVGGEIATRLGWPALFLVNLAPLAVVAALALGSTPSRAGTTGPTGRSRFDLPGSALLGAGLVLLLAGTRGGAAQPLLAGAGIGTLLLFAWWERHAVDPVVDLRLFTRRAFATGSLIIGLQNFAMYALLFELPLLFVRSFGATPAHAGRALLAMTLAMVVGSVTGGRVAGRFGARAAALLGTGVALGGGALLVLAPLAGVSEAVPALLALGLGLGLSTPAANAALMSAAHAGESGMAAAMSGTVRYLGGIAGIALVGTMVGGGAELLATHARSAAIYTAALAIALGLAALVPDTPRRAGR